MCAAGARAVECAEGEGRVSALVDAIVAEQDSLGIKSWGSFAPALAHRFQLIGTPNVLVNGWVFTAATKANSF